jgi:hypothetical protein
MERKAHPIVFLVLTRNFSELSNKHVQKTQHRGAGISKFTLQIGTFKMNYASKHKTIQNGLVMKFMDFDQY